MEICTLVRHDQTRFVPITERQNRKVYQLNEHMFDFLRCFVILTANIRSDQEEPNCITIGIQIVWEKVAVMSKN